MFFTVYWKENSPWFWEINEPFFRYSADRCCGLLRGILIHIYVCQSISPSCMRARTQYHVRVLANSIVICEIFSEIGTFSCCINHTTSCFWWKGTKAQQVYKSRPIITKKILFSNQHIKCGAITRSAKETR